MNPRFLDDAEAWLVLAALDIAAAANRDHTAHCRYCAETVSGLCDPCGERLAQAGDFRELAERIRTEGAP